MRKEGWLLCAVVWAAAALTGCGNATEEKYNAGWSNVGQIMRESVDEILAAKEQTANAAQYPELTIPTAEEENPALQYREMPDLEVDYIPELEYSGEVKICETYGPHVYACWKDMLIIGETVYRREDGIYQRTEEQLQDWFQISDRVEYAYQWENLLVTDHRGKIMALDMDSGELWSYPFDGYAWYIYEGKVYYRGDEGIHCIDLLSEEDEVIYACTRGGVHDAG